MHIKIEAETSRGLRIIEEIPDFPICRIEGYNGIGKTNAIKLLRLCTGDQPFEKDAPGWRSFRNQLANARIEISGLRHDKALEIELEPQRWPKGPERVGNLLGSVRINGVSAMAADIPEILRVFHILTTETPLDVLANRVLDSELSMTNWLQLEGGQRQEDLDKRLGALQSRTSDCLPSQLPQDLHSAAAALKLANAADSQLADAKRLASLLEKAVEVAERLDQVRGRGPELEAKLGEIQARLDDIEEQKELIDEQITAASAMQSASESAELEFENAQKFLIRQDKALRQVTTTLQRVATAAGVEPRVEAVRERQALLSGRLDEMVALLPQVHATPMLVSILSDIADRLSEAEHEDLGDTVLLEADDTIPELTVSKLRRSCIVQIGLLSERTPSAQAEKLQSDIEHARNQLDAFGHRLKIH